MPEVPVSTGLYNIVTTFDALFFKAGHSGDLFVLQWQRTKGLLYMVYRFNLTKDPRHGKWAYVDGKFMDPLPTVRLLYSLTTVHFRGQYRRSSQYAKTSFCVISNAS